MQRLLVAVCLLMLVPSAVLAEAPIQCSAAQAKLHEFAPAGQLPKSAGDHIFFAVDGLAGTADLELRYFLDGQLHLTELLPLKSLQLAASPADGPAPRTVVELLAMRPAERKLLAMIGRVTPDRVEVEIWRDGSLQRSLSFAQLQQESEALRESPFRPEVIHSEVAGKGKRDRAPLTGPLAPGITSITAAATCEGGCTNQRNECYASTCPMMDWCEECELQYQQCMGGCEPPPPSPCPTVQYHWTGWYYIGTNYYPFDQICYPDQIWYWYDGLWHVRFENVYRRDYIKKTTQCNGGVTQELEGYQYLFVSCYDWTYSACSNPWYPWNTCY